MSIKAEYIWIDGTKPTALLRSKTKILADGQEPPVWGFDGSSTNQAEGHASDCVLKPVFVCPDPIRGGDNVLVLNEVLDIDMKPHATNTRAATAAIAEKYAEQDMWFGMEQEYTMLRPDGRPLGFPAGGGLPAPQGPYYCGVGTGRAVGREIIEVATFRAAMDELSARSLEVYRDLVHHNDALFELFRAATPVEELDGVGDEVPAPAQVGRGAHPVEQERPCRRGVADGVGVAGGVEPLVGHAAALQLREQRPEPHRVLVVDGDRQGVWGGRRGGVSHL